MNKSLASGGEGLGWIGYRYGSAAVSVNSNDPDTARWLEEFLSPWLCTGPPARGSDSVRLTWSDSLCSDLEREAGQASTRHVDCFTLDSEIVGLPGWTKGGTLVIAEHERECFFRVRGSDVEIVARPGNRRVRTNLMRIVRELAVTRMRAQTECLDVHAAAFVAEDRAFLVVGPKRAGKTTLLVHALASGRTALLANDRVFVDVSGKPGCAVGVPTVVSLRAGTLALYPRLLTGASSGDPPVLSHAGEPGAHDDGATAGGPAGRLVLSTRQLAGRLGVDCARSAAVAAILFPEIDPAETHWSLAPLAPGEGVARLLASRYGGHARPSRPTVFEEVAGGKTRRNEEALVERLATGPSLYRCRLGVDAYRDIDGGRSLIGDILDAG